MCRVLSVTDTAAAEPSRDAEDACAFVIDHVKRRSGRRWLQGRWQPAFVVRSSAPAVRLVAEMRLHRIGRQINGALVAWANGDRPVHLLHHVPTAPEVLELQARGERCVSLVADGVSTVPHDDPLAFAVHDLCHLEKFMDPAYHRAQVGFFATLHRAMSSVGWASLERGFDDAWCADRDHVAADMNGSPIFLLAALKMKLKMATRRRLAREEGRAPPPGGPLGAHEEHVFSGVLEATIDLMGLHGQVRDAAIAVSTRRDHHDEAEALFRHFTGIRPLPAPP